MVILPTRIAEVLANVTLSPKNIMPLAATGSLFNAPTIEYVVLEVVRKHHAVVNDMAKADTPENTIADIIVARTSSGL